MKKNMIVWVLIVLAVVAVLVFITIKGKNKMSDQNINTVATDNAAVTNNNEVAQVGDTVSVNYTGKLADGTVFDSNVDPKFQHVQPFEFTLGAGQVIPGWDKGIAGMKVGEKKTLVIAPEDAYGAAGAGGVIPPNATLTFDVEILGITPGAAK